MEEEVWRYIEERLKEGSIDLEEIYKILEEHAKKIYKVFMEKKEHALKEIEQELMEKMQNGRIGEAFGSIEETIEYLKNVLPPKPQKPNPWEEVEKYYQELRRIQGKSFVLFKASKIEEIVRKLMNVLKLYWEYLRAEVMYRAKLETRDALIKFLEAKRREIETLLKEMQIMMRKNLNPPEGAHIALPDIDDLLIPDFKPNSTRLTEIKSEWLKKVEEKISEKVRSSFKPDLSIFHFDDVPEGWYVPEGREATPKERMLLAVVPKFVEVLGRNYVEKIVEKNGNLDAIVYRFVFGISLEEVEVK